MVSRRDTLKEMDGIKVVTYKELNEDIVRQNTLIVNGTPVGMYPHVEECPAIPYSAIGKNHILYDCIYTPEETLFLRKGREQGARTLNGLQMLELQAREAWRVFKI